MFKQILLLIVFSVIAVLFKEQLALVLKVLLVLHTQISHGLGVIFAFDRVGEIVQSVIALLIIPVVIAVLVAVAHFFIRQAHFPHTITVIWVFWAVLLTALVSHTVYSRHMVGDDIHVTHMDGEAEQHRSEMQDSASTDKNQKSTVKNNDAQKDPKDLTQKDQSLPAGTDVPPAPMN